MTDNSTTSDRSKTPQQALATRGYDRSTPFVCPYADCGVYAQHHWGEVWSLGIDLGSNVTSGRQVASNSDVCLAQCEACEREVIFNGGAMIWPRTSTAPRPSPDMPNDIASDFQEARLIHDHSPRGAAALLRLALQKLLPHIGATDSNINAGIAELVAAGTIPHRVQQALDSVRVIGNEAVHPGEFDLRDDPATVLTLFNLLNFIVEKAISEPKEIDAIYGGLPPSKLRGIEDRDKSNGDAG